MKFFTTCLTSFCLLITYPCRAETGPDAFAGQYWLDFRDGYGGWLELTKADHQWQARLLWRVGSPRPMQARPTGDSAFMLTDRRNNGVTVYEAKFAGERVAVNRHRSDPATMTDQDTANGRRCPPMPTRPNLDTVQFGEAINLLREGMDGWRLQPADAQNGWTFADGVLINQTPKTDFGAYGSFGNLASRQTFEDFQLHIEFNIGSSRNSGVYLRGLYEAQVVDRDSPMQGINGPGAIFGRIQPDGNAGAAGDTWQTYDLTLVDRHITVVLNGQKVIDNQPVAGCTGGALFGDVTRAGPIYLQGDHTSVMYRNIRLRPRVP